MSVVVLATAIPAPEHGNAVVAAFEKAIPAVHAEDEGCELYALHDGEDRLVMIEKWASLDALNAHGRGPILKEFTQAVAGKLVGELEVQILHPHPAGTEAQGTL